MVSHNVAASARHSVHCPHDIAGFSVTLSPAEHKHATKTFNYTTITDRLRTVIWSDNSHSPCVVYLNLSLRVQPSLFP